MEHLLTSLAVAVAALLPVLEPIGAGTALASLTQGLAADEIRSQARKAAIASAALLLVVLLGGSFIFDFFGISFPALETAGGLIVGFTGWQMLQGLGGAPPEPLPGGAEPEVGNEVWFSPIAFPLLAGPGTMAVVLGLVNRHDHAEDYVGFSIGIVVALVIFYLLFTRAQPLLDRIGPRGLDAITRVMGLIVVAIAAEMITHGIAEHYGLTTFD